LTAELSFHVFKNAVSVKNSGFENELEEIVVYTTMSLEDDIKQSRFGSEHQKAAINVLYTGSWIHNNNSARLKKHGITPEQYNVLRILRGSHPNKLMLAEITNRMIDKSSNATRLVEKLRQKGCVKREVCENNRRQVDISITEKGLGLMKAIDAEENEWIGSLKNITKSEAVELNRLLDKLRG
jgi:DNA-binding MarR family transcriptional regulator